MRIDWESALAKDADAESAWNEFYASSATPTDVRIRLFDNTVSTMRASADGSK